MDMHAAADKIEASCFEVIREGTILTGDLGGSASCSQFTDAICKKVQE